MSIWLVGHFSSAQEIDKDVEIIPGRMPQEAQQPSETMFGGRSIYINDIYGPQVSVILCAKCVCVCFV